MAYQRAQYEVSKCPAYTQPQLVSTDLSQFLTQCAAADLTVIGVTEQGLQKVNCI